MNMAFSHFRDGDRTILFWLHTEVDPEIAEWKSACAQIVMLSQTRSVEKMVLLVLSDGGAPGSVQRAELTKETFNGVAVLSSCVTISLSNPLKRGVATAISWVNPAFKLFHPNQWREAVDHLGLLSVLPTVLAEFEALQTKLPKNRSLALFGANARTHTVNPR